MEDDTAIAPANAKNFNENKFADLSFLYSYTVKNLLMALQPAKSGGADLYISWL